LQALQALTKLFRKKVSHDRDQLTNLNKEPLQLQEGLLHSLRVPSMALSQHSLDALLRQEARVDLDRQITKEHREGRPVRL
jgi:hypothetical protein